MDPWRPLLAVSVANMGIEPFGYRAGWGVYYRYVAFGAVLTAVLGRQLVRLRRRAK
jgi:hypothetical protein